MNFWGWPESHVGSNVALAMDKTSMVSDTYSSATSVLNEVIDSSWISKLMFICKMWLYFGISSSRRILGLVGQIRNRRIVWRVEFRWPHVSHIGFFPTPSQPHLVHAPHNRMIGIAQYERQANPPKASHSKALSQLPRPCILGLCLSYSIPSNCTVEALAHHLILSDWTNSRIEFLCIGYIAYVFCETLQHI